MRVLVVDDSDIGRMMVRVGIEGSCVCDEAKDGAEAVAKYINAQATGEPYSVVFMDIVMPDLDGKSALRAIRKHEEHIGAGRTPVYMVSASEMIDDVADLADGLLRKPIPRVKLLEIISEVQTRSGDVPL